MKRLLQLTGAAARTTAGGHRSPPRPVHFLHISKTGGSAFKHAVKQHEIPIQCHLHKVRFKAIPPGDGVIFFVRNPLTRFVSAFYSRQRQGMPRHNALWTDKEREIFSVFKSPNVLAESLSDPDRHVRERARSAMRTIGHLKHPFRYWIKGARYLRKRRKDLIFIGLQESLEDDFEIMKLMLGFPASAHLPKDEHFSHRNPGHLDRTLSATAEKNVLDWYARDIRIYKFCKAMRLRMLAAQFRHDFKQKNYKSCLRIIDLAGTSGLSTRKVLKVFLVNGRLREFGALALGLLRTRMSRKGRSSRKPTTPDRSAVGGPVQPAERRSG